MNISSVSNISTFQAARTQQQVSVAVFKKAMDVAEAQGQAAIALLEAAADTASQIQESEGHQLDVTI